ncbi:Heterokaryon incompatibility [Fusarium oxysporum f. sp. vasinfectum]|nr:Heterokaryon incompatibility [Fusarium oxysporum f. sp. vasinfectum]
MASFDYDTMSASYWGKIVAIGLVWTPSAYFSNSWVNNQPPGTFMSIAWRYLPKRLIDVGARDKGAIQLVLSDQIGSDNIVEYAALSHCWGTTVKSELRGDNEETMKTILTETLDSNFRDAADITYKLGIKYLWIDPLYIKQRTKEWEEESGDMGLVYARAKVVMSATASKNSQGGCYKPKDLFPYDCVLCSNWNSSLVVRTLTPYPDLVQLFHDKDNRETCRDFYKTYHTPAKNTVKKSWSANPKHRTWTNKKRRYDAQVSSIRANAARLSIWGAFGFLWSFRGQNMQEKAEFHLRWYEMAASYSVRNLTNDGDEMMAIAGVAYFIQQSTDFKYAAGLWEATMPFDLLWVVDSEAKRRSSGRSVPTRSWVSVDGKISHRLKKVDPSAVSGSGVSLMIEGSSVSESWEYIESLISDLEIQATHTVNGMAYKATLKLSCQLRTFDPKAMSYVYDKLEHNQQDETRCLPILELINHRVGLRTRTPQIHGLLVRDAVGT